MKRVVAFFKLPELYCALLLVACVVTGVAMRVSIDNVVLTRDGDPEKVSFPVAQKMADGELFQVELDIHNPFNASYDLRVVPDDCAESIVVNGEEVDVSGFHDRCNFSKGFLLKDSVLAPHRVGDKAHFAFSLKNNGGDAGLNLFVYQSSAAATASNVGAVLFFAVLCLLIGRRLGLRGGLLFVFFLGVAIRTVFFANVPYTTYSNDVDGHVAYVQYVLEKHAVPGVDDCWTCYHPPVYYVSSVPSFVFGNGIGVGGTTGLQTFSLLLSVATLLLGLFFLKGFMGGAALGLSSLLWTFWPLMILVAPRIGNDQMFYLMHVLCLWGGINYLNKGKGKYLIVSVVATALAMWTKTTAVVTLGTTFLFAVCGYVHNFRRLTASRSEWVAWGMFVALIAGILLQKLLGDADLVGNSSGLNGRLKVGNEAFNYIFFDLKSFVTHPYTSAWNEEWGREFFWNYAFKSSMFGEFELVRNETGRTLATLMSVSFLGMLVYAARGFWKARLGAIHWILLLQGAAFFAALMFLRIKVPYSCSNDFRYIAPVILSFVPFVGWGVSLEGASTKWKVLGYALVSLFVLSTAILYILAM
ncbi:MULTISPECIES: glycosyltransferase family 39 protein [unclassified Fibrobacter]|uniref:glycosyltransferase family 39 protein n=1 Tax=unclassified Fibrobacter TaxID=2634177 RepID=UPI0025C6D584|nr:MULTISPECIES: glycosyltransferase family 39 protein [unclassified Fibrobacter]